MERFWKYCLLLCWIFYLFLSSLSIFMNGFLLNREVLNNHATCKQFYSQDSAENYRFDEEKTNQICTESKSRVVLVIIDALMYDFTLYNESLGDDVLPYQNKMPIFSELLQAKPLQSQIYKFIADPPTTTMQRLKGLTTGSLPTFIDAGSNFASSEIDEDNFLDQLKTNNGSIVFMGDDTWNSLYPERFLREFPFPSFNVWDLDTVDQGVEHNIMPQLKEKDWNLLIAHFLGVDHCGHRHGPNHPEMSRKLREMDIVVRRIVDVLGNDSMLIVIGDHGMTMSGNHGGDSVAEVTAAMFVYSPHPLFGSVLGEKRESVNQVDLVPTLAAILGSPIPFSSLGSVVIEALPQSAKQWQSSFTAVMNNVNQVHEYLETYSQSTSQFTEDSLAVLNREYKNVQRMAQQVKSLQDFKSYLIESRNYLQKVKSMCEDVWVKFDVSSMSLGLIFMFLTIVISLISIQTVPSQKIFDILENKTIVYIACTIVICSVLSWFLLGLFLETSCILSLIVSIIFLFNNFNDVRNGIRAQRKHSDWLNFIASIFIVGNILGMFSNSYVVEESIVVSFCMISLVAAVLFRWKKDPYKPAKNHNAGTWLTFTTEKIVAVFLAVVFCVIIRLLQFYWQCREEQSWCQNIPIQTSKSMSLFKEVTFLPLISIIIPVVTVIIWLKKCGNLVELSVTITAIKIVPIIFTILTCVYWVLEALPLKILSKMITWDIQLIPQLVFSLLVIMFVCLVMQPLCVHVVPPRKKNFQLDGGDKNFVPHIFQHIKNALKEDKSKVKDNIPAVYGLPTVFSALFIVIGLLLIQLLYLLQGSKFAPPLVIMFFSSFFLLGVLATYRIHKAVLAPQLLYVPWYAVASWGLLVMTSFYGTGHQATFPGIHWQAAFVGTSGEFSSQLVPGAMVLMSTFSAHAWLGVLLPLLLICPFTLLTTFPNMWAKQDVRRGAVNGEVYLYENSTLSGYAAFLLTVKYILFFALRVCAAMATALIHRRHLMVWKVFAPKLIFESAGMAVSMSAAFLGFLLLSLLSQRLEALMTRLQDGQES